jgi:predicted DNA-binding transcriptional regulator YafY
MPRCPSEEPAANEEAEAVTVHIRFASTQGVHLQRPASEGASARQGLWVERPLLLERADGTYELIGTTARPARLVRWVLSHGAAAEVRSPARLRRRVTAEAKRIARQYESTDAN